MQNALCMLGNSANWMLEALHHKHAKKSCTSHAIVMYHVANVVVTHNLQSVTENGQMNEGRKMASSILESNRGHRWHLRRLTTHGTGY